jgi:hypothetical protein
MGHGYEVAQYTDSELAGKAKSTYGRASQIRSLRLALSNADPRPIPDSNPYRKAP